MQAPDTTAAETKDFYVVNAFAEQPFGGNPAGVFIDAEGLETDIMQAIARQMNLVETVFVFDPKNDEADFEFRYFMPEKELPVAGHPTIAAVAALIADGRIDPRALEFVSIKTGAGIQRVQVRGDEIVMQQPPAKFFPIVENRNQVAEIFGISKQDIIPELPVQPIDSGLGHLIVPLSSKEALSKIKRNIEPLKALCAELGVMEAQVFAFDSNDRKKIITRNICPRQGIEDPACGVGNGALGYYFLEHVFKGETPFEIMANQGDIVSMPSVIRIQGERKDGKSSVFISGKGKVMIKGIFYLV